MASPAPAASPRAWQRAPAARFSLTLVTAALALDAWGSCRDRASAGTYALRAEGVLAGRARGPVEASAAPLLSSTGAGFDIELTLPAAPGVAAGALRFHTGRMPRAGAYRATGLIAGPQPVGTVAVSLATARSGDPGARELWAPAGGTVWFARPRAWGWGSALSGTFRVRFVRPAPGAADTVTVTGSFATR